MRHLPLGQHPPIAVVQRHPHDLPLREPPVDPDLIRLCERSGARLTSACGVGNGTGPEAQLLRQMVDAFAQYERALIGARTKAALAAKKARGERVGGIPYGYRDEGGRLVEDEAEQLIVVRARELRAEGLSLRGIGRALLKEGRRPRNGRDWHVQVIARAVVAR